MYTYRFTLSYGSETRTATPRHDNSFARQFPTEPGQMFKRRKLEGSLKFQDADYQFINDAPFDTKFSLLIEEQITTTTWQEYFTGEFYKTDITEFDQDANIIEVTPEPTDVYTEILKKINDEYDLINLEPAKSTFLYKVQPMLQVYFIGGTALTNIIGDMYFEQRVDDSSGQHLQLTNDYKFTLGPSIHYVSGAGVISPDVSGMYEEDPGQSQEYLRQDNAYRIKQDPTVTGGDFRWIIVNEPGGSIVYQAGLNEALQPQLGAHKTATSTFVSVANSSVKCQVFFAGFYYRYLTPLETVPGYSTINIPENDIVAAYPNFKKIVTGINFGTATASDRHRTDPSRWGKIPDASPVAAGKYLMPPTGTSATDGLYYPILSSEFTHVGWWFQFSAQLQTLQEDAANEITVKDGFKVADVLSALLAEIDPTITHQESADYSAFFYGSGNSIRGAQLFPIITPKSNILAGELDRPARKAPIRLQDVFELLRIGSNVYWHIDSQKRLIIEHRHFYDNGGAYDLLLQQVGEGKVVGVDLTTQIEGKTSLKWSYKTNKWKYDKVDIPQRIEFSWMDKVSFPFEGYPIEVISGYAKTGNVESRQISKFTSDVDFALNDPSSISNDGFFYFECGIKEVGIYAVPFLTFVVNAEESYKMQNGYASFIYLQKTYHEYGLPAASVTINKQTTTAKTVLRYKIQEIKFPAASFDDLSLVKTNLGDGKIREYKEYKNDRSLELTIEHDI